jgi:Domain of unknown function (DUF5658)
VGMLLLWFLMAPPAGAQSRMRGGPGTFRGPRPGGPGSEAPEPVEIDEGFVIFDGAYVPPPYIVRWEWPAVFVNGRAVLATQARQSRRGPRTSPRRHLEYVANQLSSGGLILCRAEQTPVLVTPGRALTILGILMGEDSTEAKVQALTAVKGVSIPVEEWAALAESFQAPAELSDRVEYWQARWAELEAGTVTDMSPSPAILKTMTLAGFALAVWALGTLLRCRPPFGCDDTEPHTPGLWDRQVVRLVLLIVVLSVHDLVCTLLTHGLGSLWELNPLAEPLLTHGPTVVVFKLGLTVGAAIVFLLARSCRLAQVGSWWLGVVYTILILRWTTCSSVFIA